MTWVHLHVDFGALFGRLLLAGLVVWFVAPPPDVALDAVGGLGAVSAGFSGAGTGRRIDDFKYAVLLVTLVVGVQYSFWGNYLPRVFPLHLRGTGESFAMSFGARVLAPFAALVTPLLSNVMPGATPTLKLAHSMALVAVVATICALLLSRHLPEPSAELLDE